MDRQKICLQREESANSKQLQRLGSGVCIIEVDVEDAEGIESKVGTGFLGIFPDHLAGLLFLVTCRHVLPDEASCDNAICTFEASGQPGHSLSPSPALGFAAPPFLDVVITRVSSEVATGLPRNQQPQEMDLTETPLPGEDLLLHGYCRGRAFCTFACRALAVSGEILRFEVLSDDLPETGASGSPLTNRRGQAVAVHMGLWHQDSGVEGRATLLRALGIPSSLRQPAPLPRRVCMTGRRGTNDVLNGIYEVASDLEVYPVWVSTAASPKSSREARCLFLYKGTKSKAWTVGTRLGDGLLRSEGGAGGIIARRVAVEGDGEDPSEVCVSPAARGWEVASGPAGVLRPDSEVMLKPMSDATFAEVLRIRQLYIEGKDARLQRARGEVEVSGFPGSLSVLNGKLTLRSESWNHQPAWHRQSGSKEEVFLYRDSANSKWVLGLELGDGHSRMAHVYTSLESPGEGLVWEVDCGDRWLPFLPATVRTATPSTFQGDDASAHTAPKSKRSRAKSDEKGKRSDRKSVV